MRYSSGKRQSTLETESFICQESKTKLRGPQNAMIEEVRKGINGFNWGKNAN